MVGTQPLAVVLLAERLRQHSDHGAHGVGELDGHVAEPAEADDGYLHAGTGSDAPQGRVRGDARAHERHSLVEVQAVGDAQDEVFVHHDVSGVSALGQLSVLVEGAECRRAALEAVLLTAGTAGFRTAGQESTRQPTPTRSPTANRVTSEPTTWVTTPAISWPGTTGKIWPPHSSRA